MTHEDRIDQIAQAERAHPPHLCADSARYGCLRSFVLRRIFDRRANVPANCRTRGMKLYAHSRKRRLPRWGRGVRFRTR